MDGRRTLKAASMVLIGWWSASYTRKGLIKVRTGSEMETSPSRFVTSRTAGIRYCWVDLLKKIKALRKKLDQKDRILGKTFSIEWREILSQRKAMGIGLVWGYVSVLATARVSLFSIIGGAWIGWNRRETIVVQLGRKWHWSQNSDTHQGATVCTERTVFFL